jgi:hypothetical protein
VRNTRFWSRLLFNRLGRCRIGSSPTHQSCLRFEEHKVVFSRTIPHIFYYFITLQLLSQLAFDDLSDFLKNSTNGNVLDISSGTMPFTYFTPAEIQHQVDLRPSHSIQPNIPGRSHAATRKVFRNEGDSPPRKFLELDLALVAVRNYLEV